MNNIVSNCLECDVRLTESDGTHYCTTHHNERLTKGLSTTDRKSFTPEFGTMVAGYPDVIERA